MPNGRPAFFAAFDHPSRTTEIRFTQTSEHLYVSALAWPADHKVVVKSLAKGNALYTKGIRKVELLGHGPVSFERTKEALIIHLPEEPCNTIMPVLKLY